VVDALKVKTRVWVPKILSSFRTPLQERLGPQQVTHAAAAKLVWVPKAINGSPLADIPQATVDFPDIPSASWEIPQGLDACQNEWDTEPKIGQFINEIGSSIQKEEAPEHSSLVHLCPSPDALPSATLDCNTRHPGQLYDSLNKDESLLNDLSDIKPSLMTAMSDVVVPVIIPSAMSAGGRPSKSSTLVSQCFKEHLVYRRRPKSPTARSCAELTKLTDAQLCFLNQVSKAIGSVLPTPKTTKRRKDKQSNSAIKPRRSRRLAGLKIEQCQPAITKSRKAVMKALELDGEEGQHMQQLQEKYALKFLKSLFAAQVQALAALFGWEIPVGELQPPVAGSC
jgi:hypothetical protein